MKVSVVVPSFNRVNHLHPLLQSLGAQQREGIEMQVIIALNPSRPQAPIDKNAYPFTIHVLVAEKNGVNAARNAGLQAARGDIVLYLDDDCLVDDDCFIVNLVEWHQRYPNVIAIGGCYSFKGQSTACDIAYGLLAREWQYNNQDRHCQTPGLVGGNVSYKLKELRQAKLFFDDDLHFGGTETEFHQRLVKKGLQWMLVPGLQVTHLPQLTKKKLLEKAKLQARPLNKNELSLLNSQDDGQTHPLYAWAKQLVNEQATFNEIINHVDAYRDCALQVSQC